MLGISEYFLVFHHPFFCISLPPRRASSTKCRFMTSLLTLQPIIIIFDSCTPVICLSIPFKVAHTFG